MSILKLGQQIWCSGWKGRLVAVGYVGERYYWLQQLDGTISMVPAVDLEKQQTMKEKQHAC